MSRMCRRWAVRLRMFLYDKPLPFPTDREMELVRELQAAFSALPSFEPSGASPSETAWASNLNRLRELVRNGDPREFLRWDVVQRTMFVTFASYIEKELGYLKRCPDWDQRWRKAIIESSVGHPLPYPFYPASSGNLIHHAYHLAQFEERADRRIDDLDFILEFGGGYGSMCRLIHQMDFRGKYVIFDLPHCSVLQRFYLKSLGLPVRQGGEFDMANREVVLLSDLTHLGNLVSAGPEDRDSLFLATWSYSEVPLDLRKALFPLLSTFKTFFLSYQHHFGEVDNLLFFRNFRETFATQVSWNDWPIPHLPGNNYLFGEKTAQ